MNINVSLSDELAKFVDTQVCNRPLCLLERGRTGSMRLMERLDRAEAERLHWLQNAWREGIDSGDAGEIDFAELKQEARQRLAAKS